MGRLTTGPTLNIMPYPLPDKVEWGDLGVEFKKYPNIDATTPNMWEPTQRSFAGCDILATAYIEGRLVVCDNITTLSYSTHREKVNVPTLGRAYARRRTRGMRTIAGTLIWIVKDRAPLWRFLGHYKYDQRAFMHLPLSDALPPFDLTLTYANEYGHVSVMRIYGIDITDEGQTHSIQDMITENVMQYQAFDMDVMMPMNAEDGELPWIQNKDGVFYRAIGNLSTPVVQADGYADYAKNQRLTTWLSIFLSDYDRAAYTFWSTGGGTEAEIASATLVPPEEVASVFKSIGYDITGAKYDHIASILRSVQQEMSTLMTTYGSYWNVEANRAAIMDGTIPSANPYDYTIYGNW